MNCYRVTVETTNTSHDTFCLETEGKREEYADCEDSQVYILAQDLSDASGQLEGARVIKIERMGVGFVPEESS